MTEGLTINQGAADDQIFALKSSDVAHGMGDMTQGGADNNVETDDFFTIEKLVAGFSGGGVRMNAMMENVAVAPAFQLGVYGGQATTGKDEDGRGLIEFYATQHANNNSPADITSNGNVFNIRIRSDVGSADRTIFLVDEDGDLYADGGTTTDAVTVFDALDDAHLVRALDIARNSKDLIRDDWDSFLKYGEDKLVELGILGAKIDDGGLINVTGLQRLHNGAIWQGYVRQQEMQEKIDTLENRLLAIEGAK